MKNFNGAHANIESRGQGIEWCCHFWSGTPLAAETDNRPLRLIANMDIIRNWLKIVGICPLSMHMKNYDHPRRRDAILLCGTVGTITTAQLLNTLIGNIALSHLTNQIELEQC